MNVVTLEQTPHTHSQTRTDRSENHCLRCTLGLSFQLLLDLFNREYFKRRWIIQEVTAATQVQVICCPEILPLEHVSAALSKCLDSAFWLPRNDVAYRYI